MGSSPAGPDGTGWVGPRQVRTVMAQRLRTVMARSVCHSRANYRTPNSQLLYATVTPAAAGLRSSAAAGSGRHDLVAPRLGTLGPVTIAIRPATAGDLTAVGEVHTRARTAAYLGIVPAEALHAVSAAAWADWWFQRWTYERDTHRLAVAQAADGTVVGFTYVGPTRSRDAGELYAIHVDPPAQGDGVGRALMAEALHTMGGFGWSRALLWVLAGNAPARRFYERGGWRSDGVRRRASIGPASTPQLRYVRTLS